MQFEQTWRPFESPLGYQLYRSRQEFAAMTSGPPEVLTLRNLLLLGPPSRVPAAPADRRALSAWRVF